METLDLFLDALAIDGAAFILGAGASAPHVPTLGQIPKILAPFANKLRSFPAAPIVDSPLRRLIEPLIQKARFAATMEDWLPGAMTSATVAALLEHQIANAHWQRLPQYEVFRLLSLRSSVVSFNWDGLARARCPQRCVLHPHGRLRLRTLYPGDLDELLHYTQLDQSLDFREQIIPGLVMPGEEESEALRAMRDRVFALWEAAPAVIIIGYSFGLAYDIDYDRIWLDTFAEAAKRHPSTSIHIVSPNADEILGELAEHIERIVNVHAWSLNWHTFSHVLLAITRLREARVIGDLRIHSREILEKYRRFSEGEAIE